MDRQDAAESSWYPKEAKKAEDRLQIPLEIISALIPDYKKTSVVRSRLLG